MYIPDSSIHEIVNAIEDIGIQENETVLIMLAEQQLPNISDLIHELNKREIDFFGAIFPGLIYNTEKYQTGAIIRSLPIIQKPILIQDISGCEKNIEILLEPFKYLGKKSATAFIILDCLSSNISRFLSSTFSLLADSVEYVGCGAGFLDMESRPCVFTPDGFFKDSAIISLLDIKCSLGVHHGWKKAIGPFVVTKSQDNLIKELNWKNAFEVYKEAIETDLGTKFDEKNFYEVSSHYPFGIYTEDDENLVRDILKRTSEGDLFCAGGVPENAVLNILKGEKLSLVNSAGQALEDCFTNNDIHAEYCLIIDCIGRALFLQDDFKEELLAISNGLKAHNSNLIPEGVLSLGEIASMGGNIVEFLNKTAVVGVFHESPGTIH
ncbi:FIST C-terminal domain-containing protein [Methanolobus sp. ZRKC2]|uniref:FIST signal transduction protein n=1 Tax=Methanolobus sp. ZRKC2 TaxID=3125783 RepID=UPI0032433F14